MGSIEVCRDRRQCGVQPIEHCVGRCAKLVGWPERALWNGPWPCSRCSNRPRGVANADISRHLSIPKGSCSYIVSRLEREGYLIQETASKRYKIGLTPVALAHGALREVGIRTVAEPALYKFTSQTGLSAGIGVLQGGRVLLVDRVERPRFVDRAIQVAAGRMPEPTQRRYRIRRSGTSGVNCPRTPPHWEKCSWHSCPATGYRLIAQYGLARSTASTIVSRKRLLAELDLVRKQRYAIADGEAYSDLRALSVPIFDAGQRSAGRGFSQRESERTCVGRSGGTFSAPLRKRREISRGTPRLAPGPRQ